MVDVGIIGAGVIGCAVAEELGRRGASVVVLDAREVGGGATQASAGILAPYIEGHERGALFAQGLQSLALYDDFITRVESSSNRSIEYRRCGTLELADSPERARTLCAGAEATQDGAAAEWVPGPAVHELEPSVSAEVLGARLCATHGYVVVPALVAALAASAQSFGVKFHTHAPVEHVLPENGGFCMRTTAEEIRVGKVVVCAGSWTSWLAIADELQGWVRPVRGQLLRLRWQSEPLRHILWSSACYVVPWVDRTVLVGATAEEVGFDERATVAGVKDLLGAACEILPSAWSADFVEVRVGLRPASRDGLPIVRASERIPGLFFATGHFRNGILLAPLTAVMLADQIS
jgi:glycine oxidase